MNFAAFFYNRYGLLRSGWRLLVFLTLFISIAGVLAVFAVSVMPVLGIEYSPDNAGFLAVNGICSLTAALAAGWICGRLLESLPFKALGAFFTGGWLRHTFFGLLLGGGALAIAALLSAIFGDVSFELNQRDGTSAIVSTLIVSFLFFGAAAAWEEAMFRGYVLQTFARANLAWFAILVTALFFGVVHLSNPNAGYLSSVNTAMAGVWFGVAYLKSRDLWLPWGLHLSWNWVQGSVFGIEVSGLTELVRAPLMIETDGGPEWLTGGSYGLEGGIACTIALVLATAATWFLPISKPEAEMLVLTGPESDRLDLKRDIDGSGGMSKASDGNKVDAGLGE